MQNMNPKGDKEMPKVSLVRVAVAAGLCLSLLVVAQPAQAGIFNLTTTGSSAIINNAYYLQSQVGSGSITSPTIPTTTR